ncbi:hypothetical protein [Nannocystis punicea]|uniref:Uncharacterized protein n=1 Tax=Nannocystis punicea TaxID=2995304 RepID=A0ABY7GTA6_9BACT|nr:hypothetical protein [Nannocystis poenicansa]WAS90187.1 hypothetical protein O0S08_28670 [Nannocystis poenicansa]
MPARTTLVLVLLVACGPKTPPETDTDSATTTSTTTSTTSGAPLPTSTTTSGTTTTASEVTTDGVAFIRPNDGGVACGAVFEGDGAVRCKPCDLWLEFDCIPGYKCVPEDDSGQGDWNDTTCVPLAPDPAAIGEPCTVEDKGSHRADTCELGAICLGVDPETLTGTCVPLCQGSQDAPECPAGTACVISHEGALIPCLPTCDPLGSTCPEGQACQINFSDPDNFVCLENDPAALAPLFAPCDAVLDCAPGLACMDAALAEECDPQQSARCCLAHCDLGMPSCPGVMQECLPFWAIDPPPPEWAHLGVCQLP